jgi:inhibitor of KinA sporulation pathway (predicted exonuclease)
VYGKAVGRGKKMVGMGIALGCEKMVFEGTPHRGIDDAKNAARLLPIALKLKPSNWVPQGPQKTTYGM